MPRKMEEKNIKQIWKENKKKEKKERKTSRRKM